MISEALDCLEDYAVLLHALGQSDGAVQLHAAAASIRAAIALPRSRRDEPKRQANIEAARAAIGDTAFDAAWSEGRTWALARAIERALAPTNSSAVTT